MIPRPLIKNHWTDSEPHPFLMPYLASQIWLRDRKKHGKNAIRMSAKKQRRTDRCEFSGATSWVIRTPSMGIDPTSLTSYHIKCLPTSIIPSITTFWQVLVSCPNATILPFRNTSLLSEIKHPGMFGLKEPCAVKHQVIGMEADWQRG